MRLESAVDPVLGVVRELLDRLHATDLAYCHWKSNEHLGAALAGSTDLDILVDRRQGEPLQRILAETGFRRFAAPPLRAYPGIEDHLALDPATGRLVHLHLHYQLTLGEGHLKGYRLPWEPLVLATRQLDPAHGVYVADPGLELLLLLTRAALKRRARDRFRPPGSAAATDFGREFAWLRRRIDPRGVRELGRELLGSAVAEPLERLLAVSPPPTAALAVFTARARPALRRYQTYGRLEARLRAWLRELQWAADAINRRYLHRAVPLRRVSPRGGVVVALLGSDGAGKSTMVRALTVWLGAKLDIVPVYFGSGDGPSAFYRRPMRLAYRPLRPLLRDRRPAAARAPDERPVTPSIGGRLREICQGPWALALSFEKRGKLRRMVRARNLGMVVLCDRFPQVQIEGFNDGPLLARWREGGSSIRRALARWEARSYTQASLTPPDLVIKLMASPEVALRRKPDMTAEEICRRVGAVRSLRFPPATKVVEIAADAPLEEVLREVKRLLWQEV